MKFSIIVPVHNTEKYLPECLKSFEKQEIQDFEVLLVVNASTDKSLEICQNWVKRHKNAEILVTDIPGVSHARNMGIKKAVGEWLLFVDSDDLMRSRALSVLKYGIDSSSECDFVIANYSSRREGCLYSNNRNVIRSTDYQKALLDRAQYFKKINSGLTWNPIVLDSVWAKAYKSSIVKEKNIKFESEVSIGEDLLFNLAYSAQVGQVYCADEDVYYYRVVFQSASRKNDVSAVEKRILFLEVLKNYKLSAELEHARSFKLVDIILRCIIAGTGSTLNLENTYGRMMPVLKNERVLGAIQECRSKNLSSGKQRNVCYCLLIKLLKANKYRAALWGGYFYNSFMKFKKSVWKEQ